MKVHSSWQKIVDEAINSLDEEYFRFLLYDTSYFPNKENFLNAFSTLSLDKTKSILFGQDPYPREQSATGYAFIDGMVGNLFSSSGLSKNANKATSLRNFLKMQLKAEGLLQNDTSQEAIVKLDKTTLISTIWELKESFEAQGILLLNKSLIFTQKKDINRHMKSFEPFIRSFLNSIKDRDIELILFGNGAKSIEKLLPSKHNFTLLRAPHPYNVSFIDNEEVLSYFGTKKILKRQIC